MMVKKPYLRIAPLCALALVCLPVQATNLTGTFHHPDGSPVNGRLIFLLSQPARLADGSAQVVPRVKIFNVTNGALEPGAFLYGNDALLPAGTHYVARLVDASNNLLFEQKWFIEGESLNLNSLTPTTIGVALADPLVKNVTTEQAVEGPVTFNSGLTTFSLTLEGNLHPGSTDTYTLGREDKVWQAAFVRDMVARGVPWFDVKAFGAVCDGTTDDSAAVQAAVNAVLASSTRAGAVRFPAKVCNLGSTGVVIDFNNATASVLLEGATSGSHDTTGPGSKVICNRAGACIRFHNSAGTSTVGRGGGVRNLAVRNNDTTSSSTAILVSQVTAPFALENLAISCRGVCIDTGPNTFGIRMSGIRAVNVGSGVQAGNIGIRTLGHTNIFNVDLVGFDVAYNPRGNGNTLTGFRMEVNNTAVQLGDGTNGCTSCTVGSGTFELNGLDIKGVSSNYGSIYDISSTNSGACIHAAGAGSIKQFEIRNYNCAGDHTIAAGGGDDLIKVTSLDADAAGRTLQFTQVLTAGTVAGGKVAWNIDSATLNNRRASFCNTNAHVTVPGVRCLSQETKAAPVLESSVATGTAPLIVASTTEVANLNAQRWGGKKAIDFSAALDFAQIAAQSCGEMTISVTGAAVSNAIAAAWPAALETGLAGMMRVSAADVVTVRLCNVTASAVDPASRTYAGRVIQ